MLRAGRPHGENGVETLSVLNDEAAEVFKEVLSKKNSEETPESLSAASNLTARVSSRVHAEREKLLGASPCQPMSLTAKGNWKKQTQCCAP